MKPIQCDIPNSLFEALHERMKTDGVSRDHLIVDALAQYLGKPVHTLFQVSTSAALVEGLYQGAVQVSRLLRHGDFGLGTFIDLAGEMVMLDGVCYQVAPSGDVTKVEGERFIPYAVVTRFAPEFRKSLLQIASYGELEEACNSLRASENHFYAFRVAGTFKCLRMRVMKPVSEGVGLKQAASAQAEFDFEDIEGTLVGMWSPDFARSFSVPGYHFHFLSSDRQHGGHVLACQASNIQIDRCAMGEMHVSLPETQQFLKADLSRDPNDDLQNAEKDHSS